MDAQKVHIAASTDIPRWGCVTADGALADSNNPAHQDHIVGITDGEMFNGRWGDATTAGTLYFDGWSWTAGAPVYLNGTVLSQTPPGVGFVQQMGWALTGQSILVGNPGTGSGGIGPPGPPGTPGINGHSITVYEQPTEPLAAVFGDLWIIA